MTPNQKCTCTPGDLQPFGDCLCGVPKLKFRILFPHTDEWENGRPLFVMLFARGAKIRFVDQPVLQIA